jgi:hypothetical protein
MQIAEASHQGSRCSVEESPTQETRSGRNPAQERAHAEGQPRRRATAPPMAPSPCARWHQSSNRIRRPDTKSQAEGEGGGCESTHGRGACTMRGGPRRGGPGAEREQHNAERPEGGAVPSGWQGRRSAKRLRACGIPSSHRCCILKGRSRLEAAQRQRRPPHFQAAEKAARSVPARRAASVSKGKKREARRRRAQQPRLRDRRPARWRPLAAAAPRRARPRRGAGRRGLVESRRGEGRVHEKRLRGGRRQCCQLGENPETAPGNRRRSAARSPRGG